MPRKVAIANTCQGTFPCPTGEAWCLQLMWMPQRGAGLDSHLGHGSLGWSFPADGFEVEARGSLARLFPRAEELSGTDPGCEAEAAPFNSSPLRQQLLGCSELKLWGSWWQGLAWADPGLQRRARGSEGSSLQTGCRAEGAVAGAPAMLVDQPDSWGRLEKVWGAHCLSSRIGKKQKSCNFLSALWRVHVPSSPRHETRLDRPVQRLCHWTLGTYTQASCICCNVSCNPGCLQIKKHPLQKATDTLELIRAVPNWFGGELGMRGRKREKILTTWLQLVLSFSSRQHLFL